MGIFNVELYGLKGFGHIGSCGFQYRGMKRCGQRQFFMKNISVFKIGAEKVYALCCPGNGSLFFAVFIDQPDIFNTGR